MTFKAALVARARRTGRFSVAKFARFFTIASMIFLGITAFPAVAQSPGKTVPKAGAGKGTARPATVKSGANPSGTASARTEPGGTGTSSGPRIPAKSAAPATDVVAVVNGEPITRTMLGKLCLSRWGEETLESLVNRRLIDDSCTKRGIVISDADIDAEIQKIATKFSLSTEQLLKTLLEERGVTLEQYRKDIVWPMLALRRLAADKLTVTDEQLEQEFESEFGPSVQVRLISLTSETKAQEVLKLAQAQPNEFPSLAKRFSEDPTTASASGLIPPVRRHMGEPEVERVVFAMQPGEVSPIVKAANQYLIFRCEKQIPAASISPQYRQATTERLKDKIVEKNLREASAELFAQLQSQAKIVNVINDPPMSQKMPGVAATVNGVPIRIEELTAECVNRFGRDMLETEINNKLLQQALKKRQLSVSEESVEQEVARAAEAFGYLKKDGTPDPDTWVAEVTKQEGIGVKEYKRDAVWPSVALKQLVGDQVEVTDEDLQKGFEANYGERVEVLAIVVGNQRVAQEVWDMARKNPTSPFFGQLAEQYSIESVSRANFGEIPPIRRHGGQPQLEREAFELQKDELSGIVALGDKYIIMKCLGRTQPIVKEMSEVRDELTKDIREKKLRLAMSEEFDRIRSSSQIDNFLARTSQSGGGVPVIPASTSQSVKRPSTASPVKR